jgi:hypothetical protein
MLLVFTSANSTNNLRSHFISCIKKKTINQVLFIGKQFMSFIYLRKNYTNHLIRLFVESKSRSFTSYSPSPSRYMLAYETLTIRALLLDLMTPIQNWTSNTFSTKKCSFFQKLIKLISKHLLEKLRFASKKSIVKVLLIDSHLAKIDCWKTKVEINRVIYIESSISINFFPMTHPYRTLIKNTIDLSKWIKIYF